MTSTTASPDGPKQAAVRKLIYQLAELDGVEMDPEETGILEAVSRGLQNVNDLLERVDELEDRVETLEQRAPEPTELEYEQMDRTDKAAVVQARLRDQAAGTTGKAAVTYRDVVGIFDGQPSAGHAYDIMETAAEAGPFKIDTSPADTKRLTYDQRRE